jgi:hypothetical protein
VKQSDVLKKLDLEKNNAIGILLSDLISHNQLSLREVETLTRNLEIYHLLGQGVSADHSYIVNLMSTFAIFILTAKPSLKALIINKQIDATSLSEVLNFSNEFNNETGFNLDKPSDTIGAILCPVCVNSSSAEALKSEFYQQRQLPQLFGSRLDLINNEHHGQFNMIKRAFEVMSLGTVSHF